MLILWFLYLLLHTTHTQNVLFLTDSLFSANYFSPLLRKISKEHEKNILVTLTPKNLVVYANYNQLYLTEQGKTKADGPFFFSDKAFFYTFCTISIVRLCVSKCNTTVNVHQKAQDATFTMINSVFYLVIKHNDFMIDTVSPLFLPSCAWQVCLESMKNKVPGEGNHSHAI